jgi:hypothetical protein
VIDSGSSILHISELSFYFAIAFFAIQWAMILLAIAISIPWFISRHPLGPAIRMVNEEEYSAIMLAKSEFSIICTSISATTEAQLVWSKIDIRARVGESASTRDDPDFGSIILGKPKLVADLTWGKSYS